MSLDVYLRDPEEGLVFTDNVTHNLGPMANLAGMYEPLWRPDEIGCKKARHLIERLTTGVAAMRADPAKFRALNPPNGWGSYDGLLRFAESYLAACRENPNADVEVSR